MVGQIIKQYIDICGITVAEVAEGTGIGRARLEAMFEGAEPIGLEDYAVIREFLGVPLDMFTKAQAREKD